MSFGKRKVKKDVVKDSENTKKIDNKNDSSHCNNSSVNSDDNTSDVSVKPKKKYNFMKKTNNKSLGLLFGQTKEEKLELFIKNIKIIHPNMPNFWLQKVIENFKKKFDIK